MGYLAGICDDLLEAFFPDEFKHASTALAVDWTDAGTFSLAWLMSSSRVCSRSKVSFPSVA